MKCFFADFELEPGERLKTTAIDEIPLSFPFTIASITEVWAGEGEAKFLVGLIFWNAAKEAALAICTETDEIELLNLEDLQRRIEEMPFYYGSVLQQWYSE